MKVHQYDDHGIGVEARCKDCNKKFGNFRVYERHLQACNLPKGQRMPCLQEGLQIIRKTVKSHGCSSQREPKDDL